MEMRTPRKQNALETWYERINELHEYKIRHGHSKFMTPFTGQARLLAGTGVQG